MNEQQIVWVVFQDRASCYGGDKMIAICGTKEKAEKIVSTSKWYYWDEMEVQ